MKLRQRTFIWLLAQDDQNETPATGCKGSEKHLGLSCKELSLQTLQQTQSEGMRCPSTGTSPWLHVISFCLQRCQCFLWLSWHQIKSASHFDSTDLSTGDGRAFFFAVLWGHDSCSKSETTHTSKCDCEQALMWSHKYSLSGKWKQLHATTSLDFWCHSRRRRESRKRVGIL